MRTAPQSGTHLRDREAQHRLLTVAAQRLGTPDRIPESITFQVATEGPFSALTNSSGIATKSYTPTLASGTYTTPGASASFGGDFGGPSHYMGRDLRSAHERPRSLGLNDEAVDVFLGHFREVLEEFGVPEANITAAMEIAEGGRGAVLAR